MNSLNALSARVSPPQTPTTPRNNSHANLISSTLVSDTRRNSREVVLSEKQDVDAPEIESDAENPIHEETPLLSKEASGDTVSTPSGWHMMPKRISSAVIESIRWVLSTLATPTYWIAYLWDDMGNFAPLSQIMKLGKSTSGDNRRGSTSQVGISAYKENIHLGGASHARTTRRSSAKGARKLASNSSSSGLSSESESDRDRSTAEGNVSATGTNRHVRSKSLESTDEAAPARRSIRIKLHNEDNLRQRKHRRAQSTTTSTDGPQVPGEITPASIKSPTSPSSSLLMTKYPRAPAAPRPLIPERQPSYVLPDAPSGKMTQKTLILDLDETLIHSMAKGGRMSTGHMVEVKLNTVVGAGENATLGPQHPILYYVHKRPNCDDFLRKVCKWYNLVIFTASVQEYADPVIDWLEQERKFFSGRYYRQHCTFRNGAFIKDLSSVEPDLSKVMILDNSPLSYLFHKDNAIPIEGWINDPTDNDLLHLVPLLEGLQWVTDVRALLALQGGEDGKQ
ncbi:NLI interacting factor-like phosphatase-domain-containing protein [Amylocarpus encephaloides]|uniref:NLI interacting factor-like phosphatase-domain-containing protein n=1 Tax=Amylocarpus encephaloides TaxID=45428 RepID=A0A9P7YPP7_9HELO|nr:NLI interacting factor-like phosphatase-domain-containing protein [Amylocarpus encephaloides]